MSENESPMYQDWRGESTQKNNGAGSTGRTSRRRLLYLLGASGIAGLAGCSGTDQGASQQSGQSDKSATIALERGPTEGDEVHLYGGVDQLNPLPIQEQFIAVSPDFERVPKLATEWEMIDEMTWEFTLRDGVKFHNGVTLTAQVAAESFRGARLFADSLTEDSFTAIDEQTLKIETSKPDPFVPGALSSPNMKLQYRGDEGGDGPIGTGPFKAEDVTKGEPVTVTEFDDYWGDAPMLDELVFQGISDNQTRALALESGDVDVAVNIPPTRYKPFKESEDIVVKTKTVASTVYVFMNAYKPPTDDRNLRLALHWIVDQEAIVENFLDGLGVPAVGPFSPVIPWAINDDIPSYGPDNERAQELVKESSYDGEEMTLGVTAGDNIQKQIAELLQQKASNIGINIKVRVIEPASMLERSRAGEFNLFLFNFSSDDESSLRTVVHTKGFMNRVAFEEDGTGTTNPPNIDINPIIDKTVSTFDKDKRRERAAKVQKLIMEGGTVLPVYHPEQIFGKRASILGPDEIYTSPIDQEWSTLDRK